ncbi:zinc metalloprotease [Chitinophaga flava]|uniref:Zinc metalloprotease n=1 Tax=Chitinophaga flava TaxID=2259036 RepID=A0A365Y0B1_9BACT|nr:M43 family zinc metalloprotease [Chitinophaga flava]RBL92039.1 zinc metalloprotease [Chitinophaga flava]
MKKKALFLFLATMAISGCTRKDNQIIEQNPVPEVAAIKERRCASYDVLQQSLLADPSLAGRMARIEQLTADVQKNKSLYRLLPNGTIEIPVVVNVLYRTAAQNVSQAQIQSQIDALNADYNTLYTVPPIFDSLRASVGIRFSLKNVVRKSTTKTSWGTNDAMKKSAQGGINPTTPDSVLNLWVVGAMTGGVIGYAQFPGGPAATDGVVIAYDCFGTIGTAASPFNVGRTATHEIGHWLNLRHIWGDATCGNDLVDDTPLHDAANFGCPTYPHRSTCTGTPIEMTMNYMDYSDDACMAMFTKGQKTRMLATFLTGGGRNGFAH